MNENLHQRIKKIIAPLNSLERAVYFFSEAVRLHVLYGLILSTPAKEIKKMKCLKGSFHFRIKKNDIKGKDQEYTISKIKCPKCGKRLIDFI